MKMIRSNELMPGQIIECMGIKYQIVCIEKLSGVGGMKFKGERMLSEEKRGHSPGTVEIWLAYDTWISVVS